MLPNGDYVASHDYFGPKATNWSLVNRAKNPSAARNILALVWSSDLRHWDVRRILLRHEDRAGRAFQYVDWLFDGRDIIAVVRLAWDGAATAHDSNYMTFHRFKDFRDMRASE